MCDMKIIKFNIYQVDNIEFSGEDCAFCVKGPSSSHCGKHYDTCNNGKWSESLTRDVISRKLDKLISYNIDEVNIG